MAHDWLALLRGSTERFAATIDGADPGTPITWCPGWTLHDLVDHLGGVHQWAAHAVVDGTPDFEAEPVAPGADLTAWYRRHAAALVDVLTASASDAPAWTLDKNDRTAGFWRRRQVHETVMHTWDAAEALGAASALDPGLAWDGVLEVVEVMYPRQVRLGRVAPLPAALVLAATDVDTDADTDVRLGTGRGAFVVRDRAEVLLRLLWHRASTKDLDPTVAAILAGALTP